jgi:Spy/CpxP family protein refolding chaperone
MKTLVRLISVCSLASLGVIAVPVIAGAEPAEAESEEVVESTSAAMHVSARKMFEHALADVELRPEQEEAIDKLKSEAKERHAPVRAARRELMLALADQVEEGKIDRCELKSEVEKVASATAKARPGDRAAFERLHSILDSEQRGKFVDSLKRNWQEAKKKHDPAMMADKVAREIKLSDEQKGRLRHILSGLREIHEANPDRAEHKERWTKILDAFKGEDFDLDEIAPAKDVAAKRTKAIEGHLWAAEAVLPVLNEEQRELVARRLRDKAQGHTGTEKGAGASMELPVD